MSLVCWKCGAGLGDIPLPLSRFSECKTCHARLHVCLMCEFYDTSKAKSCREPIAEEVKDKQRANFCDYFRARPNAFTAKDESAANAARDGLDALFGLKAGGTPASPTTADAARKQLDDLFKK